MIKKNSISKGNSSGNLLSCTLRDCKKMTTILDSNSQSPVLEKAENLNVMRLPLLESLYKGQTCALKMLKELVIMSGCVGMTEIFKESRPSSPVLPRLTSLIVCNMPTLKRNITYPCKWPSLEKLKIICCPKLTVLPFTEDGAATITLIKTEAIWWGFVTNEDNRPRWEQVGLVRLYPTASYSVKKAAQVIDDKFDVNQLSSWCATAPRFGLSGESVGPVGGW
ncbi:hypothetical protein Tco_0412563 [Tanacetum coccineum]